MLTSVKAALMLSALLVLYERSSCLIIPEEVPTILSLIYSNIPPVKKGTDSRLGVGFRLGEHADFQILLELGPQTETEPIGKTAESNRRRDVMLQAAMKGDFGPLSQAVAKYQMEQRLQREIERLKKVQEMLKKLDAKKQGDSDSEASEWLSKWSKEMAVELPNDQTQLEQILMKKILSNPAEIKKIRQRINQTTSNVEKNKGGMENLTKLYKLQTGEKNK
ncbi:hypothetical protein KM043_012882 [Ampulex compressa]|nr:hypothetical protein KM043_012882 [Ampulex compressa]